ncbi:hypothetical protein DZG00_10690 [Clavibacter lycopersici]|uniref:Uncharacterized protein n=1 Tax=Clavibacter lycopersici TaxID=2301718 RepID=A0A399TA35_9MICO|nr:hypothetical protein [Clavibacter lycopersici]RIJ50971.1 hypothetical protein DZG00_10690 [Clavibacter lycopersici]RIJ61384.1 hypothetical protein DZG02_07305 [Clavibacter lycopersici]
MTDPSVPLGSAPEHPTPAPSTGAPRWLGPALFAVAVVVLGGNVFHVLGLTASGITWTDGEAAYGVQGGDASAFLPPVLAHLVGGATVLAVLFGPLVMAPITVIAAWLLWSSWRRRAWDLSASGTVLVAAALVVLLAYWGDELWVWILD